MQWEYKTMRLALPVSDYRESKVEEVLNQLEPQLNEFGEQGWELVSALDTEVLGYTKFIVAIFKRPRQ